MSYKEKNNGEVGIGECSGGFNADQMMDLNHHLAWLESQLLAGIADGSGAFCSSAKISERAGMVRFIDRLMLRLGELRDSTVGFDSPVQVGRAEGFIAALLQEFRISKRYRGQKDILPLFDGRFVVDLAPYVPSGMVVSEALYQELSEFSAFEGLWPGAVLKVFELQWSLGAASSLKALKVLRVRVTPFVD